MQILKNVTVFELTPPQPTLIESVAKKLAIQNLEEYPNSAVVKGLLPVSELNGERIFYRRIPNGYYFIVAIHERMLPNSVLNDAVSKEVSRIETEEDRKVKKTERARLKEQVYNSLLPQAFIKKTNILCVVDTSKGLLVLNSTSNRYIAAACGVLFSMASENAPQTFHGMRGLYTEDQLFHEVCRDFIRCDVLNLDVDSTGRFENIVPGHFVKCEDSGNTTTIKNLELSDMGTAIGYAMSKGQHFIEIALDVDGTSVKIGPSMALKSLGFPPVSDEIYDHADPYVIRLTEEIVWIGKLVSDLKQLFSSEIEDDVI